jgi:uncharacterized LabA/DUF88 family protein
VKTGHLVAMASPPLSPRSRGTLEEVAEGFGFSALSVLASRPLRYWPLACGLLEFLSLTAAMISAIHAVAGRNRSSDAHRGANMAEENRPLRFAVLIDADNTSPRIAAGLFEEVAKFGEASVRRIYGDFSGQRLKSWAEILLKYAIDPHQQFAYTTGKNASDIALVIDAMDLLHSRRLDGFCLVSSDSDFTRLASRLREEGAEVYGFGEQKTPESFRQACRRFIYTENLLPEAQPAPLEDEPVAKALQPPSAAIPILAKAIAQMETEDGWVGLGVVGQHLANIASDFDPRTYGFRKLSDLVRKTGAFDLDQPEGRSVRIRAKPAKARLPSSASGGRGKA